MAGGREMNHFKVKYKPTLKIRNYKNENGTKLKTKSRIVLFNIRQMECKL